MAETTPLLPRPNRPPHEHSIFQRVCHSPWYHLDQRGLFFTRGFLALYLTTTLVFGIIRESRSENRVIARLLPFDASLISFVIQTIYYWITAIWAFEHLTGPHHRLPPHEQAKGRVLANIQNAFSIPKNTDVNSKRRLAFSLFYTAAIIFPLVTTTVYWLFLFPLDFQPDPLSWPRFLQYFKIANFTIINSVVALLEVMVISSVQKQKPLGFQLKGITAICMAYVLWVVLCRYITGQWIYGYFDSTQDWRTILQTYTYISSLTVNVFMTQRALHALRERMARKAQCDHRGR
ncbi:hypothetical protein N7G274_003445 [Stereocaulon virgatum]|uniref:Uncharacterized protein n=1 Tax=Stereocaulon virgatum TaxID=373712 RepID=A0ABR4ADS9_9LECA